MKKIDESFLDKLNAVKKSVINAQKSVVKVLEENKDSKRFLCGKDYFGNPSAFHKNVNDQFRALQDKYSKEFQIRINFRGWCVDFEIVFHYPAGEHSVEYFKFYIVCFIFNHQVISKSTFPKLTLKKISKAREDIQKFQDQIKSLNDKITQIKSNCSSFLK